MAGTELSTGDSHGSTRPTTDLLRRPRIRLGAIVSLALAAGAIGLLASSGKNGSPGTSTLTTTTTNNSAGKGAVAISAQGLMQLANVVGHPIYWSGPKPGYTYELTETTNGSIYIRYLPAGVRVGDPRSSFVIVATYPYPNALGRLRASANGDGTTLPGGGFALPDRSYPKSVHLAYPGVGYEVEVYSPSPELSRRIALSGKVRPVG